MGCGASTANEPAAQKTTPAGSTATTGGASSSTTASSAAPPAPAQNNNSTTPPSATASNTTAAPAPAPAPAQQQQPIVPSDIDAKAGAKEGPKIIIAGPPACGKGAHCSFIVEEYGVLHISTGDVMREEMDKKTDNGLKIKQCVQDGQEIGDDLLVAVVAAKLKREDVVKRGWLLDGFPRSAEQAAKLKEHGIKPDVFLLLHIPDTELVDRVTNRRLDPETGAVYHITKNPPPNDPAVTARLIQRADDTADKIQARLNMFHKTVEAIRPYYDQGITKLDGFLEGDDMQKAIRACIRP